MSIAERVKESVFAFRDGRFESALLSACIAAGATSRREHPSEKRDSVRYKAFVHDYRWLIGYVGLRGVVANRMKLASLHPDLKPAEDGSVGFEDVLYSVVRCCLVHEGGLQDYVILEPNVIFGYKDGKYQLPNHLSLGLIAAVVASPVNANERIGTTVNMPFLRSVLPLDLLWGKRDAIAKMMIDKSL